MRAKHIWISLSSFLISAALFGANWVGYPYYVQTPYTGGGKPGGSQSSSFLMVLVDADNQDLRQRPMFRRMLTEVTGVCNDKDPYNISCDLCDETRPSDIPCIRWLDGETYLILSGLDLKPAQEKANFRLVTTPPQSLISFCGSIQSPNLPCIAERYPRHYSSRRSRNSGSEIFALFPNHGTQNPMNFSLFLEQSKNPDEVQFEGKPFKSQPTAKDALIQIGFRPIRENARKPDTGQAMAEFLRYGNEVQEIELTLYYRGTALVVAPAARCDLPDCGMPLSKATLPTTDDLSM